MNQFDSRPKASASSTLSKEAFELSTEATSFLKAMYDSKIAESKFVFAATDTRAILALGPTRIHHVKILDSATQIDWNLRVVTAVDPSTAKPLPGYTVQGGRFSVDWSTGVVSAFGSSITFGPTWDGVFDERTTDVVAWRIARAVRELLSSGQT